MFITCLLILLIMFLSCKKFSFFFVVKFVDIFYYCFWSLLIYRDDPYSNTVTLKFCLILLFCKICMHVSMWKVIVLLKFPFLYWETIKKKKRKKPSFLMWQIQQWGNPWEDIKSLLMIQQPCGECRPMGSCLFSPISDKRSRRKHCRMLKPLS